MLFSGKDGMFAMSNKTNRRDFLKIAAAAGVGMAPLCAGAKQAKVRPWRMKLSTSSIHFDKLPIEQACKRIADLGFKGIDIWSAHAGCPHLDDVADRLGADGLKAVLAKYKLKLFAFSVYKGGYERYAELLGRSGGGTAVQGSTKGDPDASLTANMRNFIEGLKPLAELAEEHDSYLAIENHGGALLNSIDSLKAFTDINTSPRLGIALAPFHLQRQNASVPDAIRICGRQLFFFYAWQNFKGSEQLPGIGPTDMTPWLKALAEIRYRGYINPFMHGHAEPEVMSADLAKAKDYLTECHKKLPTADR